MDPNKVVECSIVKMNKSHTFPINLYTSILLLVWTLVILGLAKWTMDRNAEITKELAENQARANFNKDKAFRLWLTGHGRLYIPVGDKYQPDPFLAHIEDRDLTTPSGIKLSMINPARIVRELDQQFSRFYGVGGRVTSLTPIRPENYPDEWEREALLQFDNGVKEVIEYTTIKGEPFLRLIQPLPLKKGCLLCHPNMAKITNGIGGGVTIALHMKELLERQRKENRSDFQLFAIIWLVGTLGILIAFIHLKKQIRSKVAAIKAFATSESHNNAIMESALDSIITINSHGIVTDVNPATEKTFGYKRSEMIGHDLAGLIIPPELREKHHAGLARLLTTGESTILNTRVETTAQNAEGEQFPVELAVTQIIGGEEPFFTAYLRDMTDKKNAAAQQTRMQSELEQARKMEALGQLTGGIAHDFNNILGIISGNAEMGLQLYGTEVPEKMTKHLETILGASDRAKNLIAQMMTYSRSSKVNKQLLQLAPLIEENIKMLGSILPSSIRIEIDCEENLPHVLVDSIQLQQIIMNLCVNAKDAMDGAGDLTIALELVKDINNECSACHKMLSGDWIRLSVTDTGSGMTPEVLDHIFEPYYTTKEVGKGTGMGLAVLNGIITSCKGHIIVDTAPGQGTTFHLLFPPILNQTNTTPVKTTQLSDTDINGIGSHILVVDDEPELAEYITYLLELNKFQVTSKTDSIDALEHFRNEPEKFSLVITDQTMPKLTGLQLINKIREIRADFPAIICSGYNDVVNADNIEDMRISYLSKPTDSVKLIQSVKEFIGSSTS